MNDNSLVVLIGITSRKLSVLVMYFERFTQCIRYVTLPGMLGQALVALIFVSAAFAGEFQHRDVVYVEGLEDHGIAMFDEYDGPDRAYVQFGKWPMLGPAYAYDISRIRRVLQESEEWKSGDRVFVKGEGRAMIKHVFENRTARVRFLFSEKTVSLDELTLGWSTPEECRPALGK